MKVFMSCHNKVVICDTERTLHSFYDQIHSNHVHLITPKLMAQMIADIHVVGDVEGGFSRYNFRIENGSKNEQI